jgi:hypothetical protein
MVDYYKKYLKYKMKYSKLKQSNILQTGGYNWCRLPKDAKLYFGSGGSDGIIAVLKDRAYKYFPVFSRLSDNKDDIADHIKENKYEIEVIKELTKTIVKPKISPHIIEYYDVHKCNESPDNIFKDCPSYAEMLKSKKKSLPKCDLTYKKGYPRTLQKPMYILEMEKADGSLSSEIEKISKKRWDDIKDFLNCLFFQVFYTLESIKLVHSNYTHNDLFIRNIMIKNTKYSDDEYIRYHYKKMIFDVPANCVYIKLNDFGMNEISQEHARENGMVFTFVKNKYRDYFSIIYDIYNGGNLGGNSLYNLIKNKDKLKLVDKYFNQFMDVKMIKKIIKNNKKRQLDWDWEKTFDQEVVELFGLKNINDYLEHFKDIYPYDKNHKIVEEYGI